MAVHVYNSIPELLTATAEYVVKQAVESVAHHQSFNIVLAGGNSPENLYRLLSSENYKQRMPWSRTNFFFGDERYVPEEDSQRNSAMVYRTLFNPLHISPNQINNMDTSLPPQLSAQNYEAKLVAHFFPDPVCFDLILLGLGANAHTASLFPHTSVLQEQEATVKEVWVSELNSYRITMTAPLINQGKHIAFLVYGSEKAEAIQKVIEGKRDISSYPAQLISPQSGHLNWFLDKEAASSLEE